MINMVMLNHITKNYWRIYQYIYLLDRLVSSSNISALESKLAVL